MSDQTNSDPEILSHRLGFFGRVDDAIFKVETVVIVVALVIMSVTVFTDIVYNLVSSLQQRLERGEAGVWTSIIGLAVFVGGVLFAATGREGEESRPLGVRLGLTAVLLAGVFGAAVSLVYFQSSTVYRVATVALLVPAFYYYHRRQAYGRLGLLAVFGAVTVWWMGSLPEGYSWAQSYSLFLLLWVGFLGASVAARERRHLKVDLLRSLLPPKWQPHYNAVAYLLAAVLTAGLVYFGWQYIFGPERRYVVPIWEVPQWMPAFLAEQIHTGPLPDDAGLWDRMLNVIFRRYPPGAIPDWMKAFAIPASAALIVIRFFGHAVAFAGMAWRGESFEEETRAQ